MDGKVLKVFRFDNLKRNLFELIVKLNTDSHGNIFAVDFEFDSPRGRIIKLNNEGQRIWVYGGHPKVKLRMKMGNVSKRQQPDNNNNIINSYYMTFFPSGI